MAWEIRKIDTGATSKQNKFLLQTVSGTPLFELKDKGATPDVVILTNLKLIAASPDMYEALSSCYRKLLSTAQFDKDPMVLSLRETVLKALAKVEGK